MRRFSFWCRARLVPSDRRLSLVSLEFVPRIPTYFRLLPVFSFSVVGYKWAPQGGFHNSGLGGNLTALASNGGEMAILQLIEGILRQHLGPNRLMVARGLTPLQPR